MGDIWRNGTLALFVFIQVPVFREDDPNQNYAISSALRLVLSAQKPPVPQSAIRDLVQVGGFLSSSKTLGVLQRDYPSCKFRPGLLVEHANGGDSQSAAP